MTDLDAAAFIALTASRKGHFRLESGLHSGLWLDLDDLFADLAAVSPFVDALANVLRHYRFDAVCGPLLGGAFLAQLIARSLGVDFLYSVRSGASESPDELFAARYELPAALRRRVTGRRIALVDDVMSAGSSLRATRHAIGAHGGVTAVVGAMLQLGAVGAEWFVNEGVPVEAAVRGGFDLWEAATCPLCAAGEPLAVPTSAGV